MTVQEILDDLIERRDQAQVLWEKENYATTIVHPNGTTGLHPLYTSIIQMNDKIYSYSEKLNKLHNPSDRKKGRKTTIEDI